MRTRSILSGLGLAAFVAAGAFVALRGSASPSTATNGLPIAPDKLLSTVRTLVEAGPAAEGMASKDRVQALIAKRLRASGAKVQELAFSADTPAGRWDLVNVLASFNPQAKHRVILGTHWDTRLWAENDPDPEKKKLPITGANDGCSGTAVLIEIADYFNKNPPPDDVGVDLAFFDGEEGFQDDMSAWFYGSKDLADRWYITGLAPPKAGVFVDMVARKGLRIPREGISNEKAREVMDQVFAIAKAKGYASFADEPGKQILDDDLPFLARDIPIALLIDLEDPVWHTHEDTLEKIEPKGMAEVADVVLTWVRQQGGAR